jgi:ribosomal protein S18 acetylase RimI-like enzyme
LIADITFKKADENDIPLIRELAQKIWRHYYIAIITPEQIEYMLADWYSHEKLLQLMRQDQLFTIVYANKEPVGYIAIEEKEPGHFKLAKLYLDTNQHRKGLGTAAFKYALETICKNYKTITLQVNRRNINAVNFYFKQGFVIERPYDFDIGNGEIMDDFVMILKGKNRT